jgi:hypothetical protein
MGLFGSKECYRNFRMFYFLFYRGCLGCWIENNVIVSYGYFLCNSVVNLVDIFLVQLTTMACTYLFIESIGFLYGATQIMYYPFPCFQIL